MIVRSQTCLVLLAALAMALACAGPAWAAEEQSTVGYFTLDNGLQVLLQEKHGSGLTAMTLAIDLGTKDETDATSGYAHLLEHMLLFGAGDHMDSVTWFGSGA